jgi:hypothetical protein
MPDDEVIKRREFLEHDRHRKVTRSGDEDTVDREHVGDPQYLRAIAPDQAVLDIHCGPRLIGRCTRVGQRHTLQARSNINFLEPSEFWYVEGGDRARIPCACGWAHVVDLSLLPPMFGQPGRPRHVGVGRVAPRDDPGPVG